jgi:hypothetical protein
VTDDVAERERDRRFRLYLGGLLFSTTLLGYALVRTDSGVPVARVALEVGVAAAMLATVVGVAVRVGRRRERREEE